jgi:hypothetical protein
MNYQIIFEKKALEDINKIKNSGRKVDLKKLDVIFANRYLEAYHAYKAGQRARKSWQISFEAKNKDLLLMQHLLLGMNAHINLDLGIAAAQTVESTQDIKTLHNDFNKINEVYEIEGE